MWLDQYMVVDFYILPICWSATLLLFVCQFMGATLGSKGNTICKQVGSLNKHTSLLSNNRSWLHYGTKTTQDSWQELGNCPMGQRNKGFIEFFFEFLSTFWNLVKILEFGQNFEIWSKFWNLFKILKFGNFFEIW